MALQGHVTDLCTSRAVPIVPLLGTTAPLLGDSVLMREIKAYIGKVAVTDSTVLITGETGTGKELIAELLHRKSPRQKKPLICVNCAAIPETLIESELFGYDRGAFTGAYTAKDGLLKAAAGGTIFFDEIGEMSLSAQAKVLRALECKEVYPVGGKHRVPLDVRILAATNQELESLVEGDKFRTDLFFRLNVARIHLPPLRDRKEDLPLLCAHYVQEFNRRFQGAVEGLSAEVWDMFQRYSWPGNVRELKNVLEAAFINRPSRTIGCLDLPAAFRRQCHDIPSLSPDERERVLAALLATNGNKSKAAEQLHCSRMTLYRKLTKYQIVS
jgi:transcriptional regulator with PAS, ATPase and Fis domain